MGRQILIGGWISSGPERHAMSHTETITTTAGKVATELARRGIAADKTVTITIELDKEPPPPRSARAGGRRRAQR